MGLLFQPVDIKTKKEWVFFFFTNDNIALGLSELLAKQTDDLQNRINFNGQFA